jgi:hypothetical protein
MFESVEKYCNVIGLKTISNVMKIERYVAQLSSWLIE